jgi:hypothetical protein
MSDPNEKHYRLYLTREELQFLYDLINANGVAFPYKAARIAVAIGSDLEDALKTDPSIKPAADIPLPPPSAAPPPGLVLDANATVEKTLAMAGQ